ncbi:MAG: DMT family transporter [Limnohabitans sp.]|nr:DMT family transporter [Limnohabitans sp.]
MPYAPPFHFLAWRYLFSIFCFLIWIYFAQVAWPTHSKQWFHLTVTGALMHAGYLGGVWSAVKLGMGAGLTSLIVGFQPVLTGIWLSSTGGQVTKRQWMGLILGFVGLMLVVSKKIESSMEVTPWSLFCILTALVSITIGTPYQKKFVQPCDVRSANTVQLISALLLTAPLAFLETGDMDWNVQLWGSMAWSVLGLTLGGSSLLYMLIQRSAAASVTSLMYLVPPTTAFLAWILFDEVIAALTLIGIALTAVGVSLVVRPGSTKSDK